MNLAIDIGNTRVKCGIFQGKNLEEFRVFEIGEEVLFFDWITEIKYDKSILASVRKNTDPFLLKIQSVIQPVRFDGLSKLPINISYLSPETLGQDRIAALCGAYFLHPENNILVVNAGSCITIDLLEANGTFLGGNIAPGMKMRWKAMHEFTGRLPLVEFAEVGDQILGNDTTSALRLGVIKGILHEIRGYFTELHSKYSFLKCVMTGGDAPQLIRHSKMEIIEEPYLVLHGLNQILIANEKTI
ncbi:MAG: type III pantothenate kinase [Saprospiraceae bacterium]|nr:type III pantothenate kinase [Candidatus Vicinibacter affinis]